MDTNGRTKAQDDEGKKPPATEPKETASNDFVIRDGFPALRLPSGKGPWIEGVEPLPRQQFWAQENALSLSDATVLEQLRADCETVFSARTREDDQAYSAGVTYFCPCEMKPRCVLEAIVLDIFRKHTEDLQEGVFVPEQSGAEWWTLVLDEEEAPPNNDGKEGEDEEEEESDEVGMHFDADYGLEDQAPNLLLHPRLGTVTYLSDCGAPTLVLNQRSPPPDDIDKKTLEGTVDKGWLSHPRLGKHIAFDGRLLHGAPATFFPGQTFPARDSHTESPPPAKKPKQDKEPTKRYTLLVNVWLNHCPLDAELLDEEHLGKLVTPWCEKQATGNAEKEGAPPPYTWNDFFPQKRESDPFQKASLSVSKTDPAGEEEVVICSRLITVHYKAAMDDLHKASSKSTLVELDLRDGVVSLEVGDEVSEETEEYFWGYL